MSDASREARKAVTKAIANTGAAGVGQMVDTGHSSQEARRRNREERERREAAEAAAIRARQNAGAGVSPQSLSSHSPSRS
ncbi:hypothetical protein N7522_006448 [Penicillium canescens]|nr:hypothetical protein N7522_006287 [Penicillium canescens]KAJ6003756.1 hypothetical protein N7522_006448 [Penicillium canescens]